MAFFKSVFSRFHHESTPLVTTNMCIDSWCHQLRTQPTRFVKKIEMCTALTTGKDARNIPVDKTHLHTLLRVSVLPMPSGPGAEEDVLFIERVLSTGRAYHSVTPVSDALSTGGTLFHPDVHDRVCVVSNGPSSELVHHLQVERILAFGSGPSDPHLTLVQFAQVLEFVSRTTKLICPGGDCKFQSRSFAFTCLAALTPSLPPPTVVHKGGERSNLLDDSVFEHGAEAFLGQVPWLVRDPASIQAVSCLLSD